MHLKGIGGTKRNQTLTYLKNFGIHTFRIATASISFKWQVKRFQRHTFGDLDLRRRGRMLVSPSS
jgi:hypothetical protein